AYTGTQEAEARSALYCAKKPRGKNLAANHRGDANVATETDQARRKACATHRGNIAPERHEHPPPSAPNPKFVAQRAASADELRNRTTSHGNRRPTAMTAQEQRRGCCTRLLRGIRPL